MKKTRRGKAEPQQPPVPQLEQHPKDKYIPLWEKSEPVELDCDIEFEKEFIQVKLYDESFKVLTEKARELVKVPYFSMIPIIYAKAKNPDIKILDYFQAPFDTQPIGSWKGRAKVQLKWLVKTHHGFIVKSNVSMVYLMFKY